MGRHAIEPETEPIVLPVTPRGLHVDPFTPVHVPGVTPQGRPPMRHGLRRRRDGELVLAGFVLVALGGVCALLSHVTAGAMPQVAGWAWLVGGLTAWAVSGVRPRRELKQAADRLSTRRESVDTSSSVDVRTA